MKIIISSIEMSIFIIINLTDGQTDEQTNKRTDSSWEMRVSQNTTEQMTR